MKVILPDVIDENKSHKIKMALVASVLFFLACLSTQIPMELTMGMPIPFFVVCVLFCALIYVYSKTSTCPKCKKKIQFKEKVLIPDTHETFGEYLCIPWVVFHCPTCEKDWRIQGLVIGKKRPSISKEMKEELEQAAGENALRPTP